MRATLLVVVAHAAALAVLCAAGQTENSKVWRALEAHECSVAKAELADLQLHVAELHVENIALRKVGEQLTNNLDALRTVSEQLANNLDECRAENVKQPLVWRDHRDDDTPPVPPLPQIPAPRRATLATPAPTPLTPIPTPFTPIPTTATPSATPSASPVPMENKRQADARILIKHSTHANVLRSDPPLPRALRPLTPTERLLRTSGIVFWTH